jgi:hypothetical protein
MRLPGEKNRKAILYRPDYKLDLVIIDKPALIDVGRIDAGRNRVYSMSEPRKMTGGN